MVMTLFRLPSVVVFLVLPNVGTTTGELEVFWTLVVQS
jgi:hypothetical protein